MLLLLCVCAPARAALPDPVAKALAQQGLGQNAAAFWLQAVDSPEPEIAHNGQTRLNPASVMKLVTTAAALDLLGPAHTFQTRVWSDGPLRDGVIEGSLYLQGGGDPGLTQARAWQLLRELRQAGVRGVRGDLVLDGAYYALPAEDPALFDQAPLRPYNAQPAALLVNHNTVALRIRPAGNDLLATLDPPALPLDMRLEADRAAACPNGFERPDIRHESGAESGGRLILAGPYPVACGGRIYWVNLLPPEANAALHLAALWQELGGTLQGRTRWGRVPANATLLYSHASLPLALLVRDINKFSNNVMARMLFLNLGAAQAGEPATLDKARAAVLAWLSARGLAMPGTVFDNGSGLSRQERLSAETLARLLRWAARQPWFFDFAASLPILGVDGTLKTRLADTPLAGRAWLKTGSLNGTRALAGYVRGADGRLKCLVLLINDARVVDAWPVQEAALRWALAGPAQ